MKRQIIYQNDDGTVTVRNETFIEKTERFERKAHYLIWRD